MPPLYRHHGNNVKINSRFDAISIIYQTATKYASGTIGPTYKIAVSSLLLRRLVLDNALTANAL